MNSLSAAVHPMIGRANLKPGPDADAIWNPHHDKCLYAWYHLYDILVPGTCLSYDNLSLSRPGI